MKTIVCKCSSCGKEFNKPLNEYTRRLKITKIFYCSRQCGALNNLRNFGDKMNRIPPKNMYRANPFKYYIRNIKKRDASSNLSLEDLEKLWTDQQGLCTYTKIKLVLNSHSKRNRDIRYTASLDRIDSSKGYVTGNVQFVSMPINYMKNTMSHNDTIEFINLIKTN